LGHCHRQIDRLLWDQRLRLVHLSANHVLMRDWTPLRRPLAQMALRYFVIHHTPWRAGRSVHLGTFVRPARQSDRHWDHCCDTARCYPARRPARRTGIPIWPTRSQRRPKFDYFATTLWWTDEGDMLRQLDWGRSQAGDSNWLLSKRTIATVATQTSLCSAFGVR
jgi:hypothetical protein